MENPSHRSFEEIAKKDTFDDLCAKIRPLVGDKKYTEARSEISDELNLLAQSLGDTSNDRRKQLREDFEAFLPEDMRWILTSEIPDTHSEATDSETDEEIVARMEKEGWKFVGLAEPTYEMDANEKPQKEIKIIGRGRRSIIFERDKEDIHGDYNYE